MPPANYRRTNPEAVPWYVPKQSQAFKRICYRLDLTDGAHSRLATEGPSEYSCKASDREFTLDHRSPVSHGGKSVSVRRPVLSHSTLGSDGARPGMPALGARSYKSGLANRRDLSRRRQRSGLAPDSRRPRFSRTPHSEGWCPRTPLSRSPTLAHSETEHAGTQVHRAPGVSLNRS